ncbi:fibronectin [Bacillus cereus]|uniref:Fibronectin n=1 Tax=Bacillus cereus TaxID=1396 RepID=A0A2A8ZZR7_BACCE|nr:fibronectin [Bacillus cereus]
MSRLTPTDIHLPPEIGVSHLHFFEEGVFCRKMINEGNGFPSHPSLRV